ncbi:MULTISPECIES: thermonuclease family protein [Bacillota]|uniref:thermonuclease family protein n=1 Tax=Bacillota TaxID=1239 RepID=UPI0039EE878B
MKMRISQILIVLSFLLMITACSEGEIVGFKEAPKYEPKVGEDVGPLSAQRFQEKNTNPTSGPSAVKEENNRETVKVIKVTDGDTVTFADKSGNIKDARLIGINSPEYTKEKQVYGKEATDFLTNLVLGKEIEIERDPNAAVTDRYGRYLVHAFIGGKSVQYLLIMEGLARVAYLYDDYQYIDMYKEAEGFAQKAGLNIWSVPGYVDGANGFNMEAVSDEVENKLLKGFNFIKEKLTTK